MKVAVLSIYISWDSDGKPKIELGSPFKELLSDAEASAELLTASVLMAASGQLGVLLPKHSLNLCGNLLEVVGQRRSKHQPIDDAIKSIRIDIHSDNNNDILHTFHPELGASRDESKIEHGVVQFLSNFASHMLNQTHGTLIPYLQAYLVIVVLYYLDGISEEIERAGIDLAQYNPRLNARMNHFSRQFYGMWSSRDLSQFPIKARMKQAKRKLNLAQRR